MFLCYWLSSRFQWQSSPHSEEHHTVQQNWNIHDWSIFNSFIHQLLQSFQITSEYLAYNKSIIRLIHWGKNTVHIVSSSKEQLNWYYYKEPPLGTVLVNILTLNNHAVFTWLDPHRQLWRLNMAQRNKGLVLCCLVCLQPWQTVCASSGHRRFIFTSNGTHLHKKIISSAVP